MTKREQQTILKTLLFDEKDPKISMMMDASTDYLITRAQEALIYAKAGSKEDNVKLAITLLVIYLGRNNG